MDIWLDSETYSEVDLKKQGVMNYTRNCEPILITYAFDDQPVRVWQTGEPLPQDLIGAIAQGHKVYAHNALFDYLALRKHLPLTPEQLIDTMAVAALNNLPLNLDQWGQLLGIKNTKLKSGTALIRKFCMPTKKGIRTQPQDAPEHWAEFVEYAVMDVEAMREAYKLCRPLSPYEQGVWQFTQRMNLRGAPVDVEAAKHFAHLADCVKDSLNQELMSLTGVPSASQVANLKQWLNEQGCMVEGLAKDNIAAALRDEQPDYIRRVLEIRQQSSMTSPRKFTDFMNKAYDGRIHGMSLYHGASTGRYSARGIQIQNIPRGSQKDPVGAFNHIKGLTYEEYQFLYGDTIDPLSSVIRPTIAAKKGKKFVDFDYSSVENRVGAWVGMESRHLDLFRKGLDEYKDFAVDMYHIPYAEVTKAMRTMAKPSVLGAIYGLGAKGMVGYYEAFGIELEFEEAQRLVNLYREKHKGIAKAWKSFGKCALQAVNNRSKVFETNRCKLMSDGRFLRLRLPSERVISWYAPKVEPVKAPWGDMIDSVTYIGKPAQGVKWIRQQLIGSSIFQSVVQASARDLLVHAVQELESFGAPPILTIHDQVICEVDEDWDDVEEFKRIMTTPPEWGKDIPLAVEGGVLYNYIKD